MLTLQTALAQAYKGAGHEGAGNLLLGIANKNVSLWDFRTAQGAVAEYQDGHAYTSGKGFTAVATGGSTGSSVGTAVVADAKGGIKVFQGGKFSKVGVLSCCSHSAGCVARPEAYEP